MSKEPTCTFCGTVAAGNLVFNDNQAVGMSASISEEDGRRMIYFGYGSDLDGDVCEMRDDAANAVSGEGTFSCCDDCGRAMVGDGRLKRVRDYLTGEVFA